MPPAVRDGLAPLATKGKRAITELATSPGVVRPVRSLRRLGLIATVVLLVQFLLGMATNLWVTIPPTHAWSHLAHMALFMCHAVLGLATAMLGFAVLSRAYEGGGRAAKAWATIGLLGVLAALGSGVAFVDLGGPAVFSFLMACGWSIALLANVQLACGKH